MYDIVSPTVRFVEDAICQLRQVLLGLNKVPFMHRFSPNLNEYLECTHHRMWNLNCTCITIQSMLNQINLDYIQSVFNQLKLLYTVSQLNLYLYSKSIQPVLYIGLQRGGQIPETFR